MEPWTDRPKPRPDPVRFLFPQGTGSPLAPLAATCTKIGENRPDQEFLEESDSSPDASDQADGETNADIRDSLAPSSSPQQSQAPQVSSNTILFLVVRLQILAAPPSADTS